MPKNNAPQSGEFFARVVAALFALAFVGASLNSAHEFQISSTWVTKVFTPRVGTRTSPAAVALACLDAVSTRSLLYRRRPTKFLVPALPLLLT
jgi:hypothetical protein